MSKNGNATPSVAPVQPVDALSLAGAASDYLIDAWQRSLLYADVRRQRGNQYRAHLLERAPNVLHFEAELLMSGLELPRPVNYGLARIVPPAGKAVDPARRPFVVVDPRAGHGPGIGGFKPDSEIGAALEAGHPCYFVGFLPDPVPGQTVEDVMRAEAAFVRKVAELHPDSIGKPTVIGNCQAGWQVLMTAAVWPELFGPIILAGAPLSYWAGDNPMRYAGGLTGGSWLTAMTSDLGAGRFDGAWLVQNFERLDPANTLWSKQYNVYAKVDTEGPRYLEFEKYWGGHVFLEGGEMQYIVDNLFIGNKLATAELVTSDGTSIDLRNIRSPIVVFCSYGDNITPPGQALGWITDLYRDDDDVVDHDQTIVFATHDSIGHLGIFVSASVGRKEHRELASNIDLIDGLPAGIYRAVVDDVHEEHPGATPAAPSYLMTIRRSSVEEVRGIVRPDADEERRFAAAARISEINLALYRNTVQPWVRACSAGWSAAWLQKLHPMRIGYEWWSDQHPWAGWVAALAEQARKQRWPVTADNPFLHAQQAMSNAVVDLLDGYRDARDRLYAQSFKAIYGSPVARALAGQSSNSASPARPHPGDSPEHRRWLAERQSRVRDSVNRGGLAEAGIRALYHVLDVRGQIDDRLSHCATRLIGTKLDAAGADALRRMVRAQSLLMRLDGEAAVAAIPALLATTSPARRSQALSAIQAMLDSGDALTAEEQERLQRIRQLFVPGSAQDADPVPSTGKPPRRSRGGDGPAGAARRNAGAAGPSRRQAAPAAPERRPRPPRKADR
ncbi:MAG: DUF3141 domain-containing protein [Rhodanobacter sp.]|nr:DUF3141 domain-containing protein [Rhodanobacter sp.]